ncbi:MAG TPA: hypothetical protein VIT68_02290 [Candidatus Gracilibacteria bacterium]
MGRYEYQEGASVTLTLRQCLVALGIFTAGAAVLTERGLDAVGYDPRFSLEPKVATVESGSAETQEVVAEYKRRVEELQQQLARMGNRGFGEGGYSEATLVGVERPVPIPDPEVPRNTLRDETSSGGFENPLRPAESDYVRDSSLPLGDVVVMR